MNDVLEEEIDDDDCVAFKDPCELVVPEDSCENISLLSKKLEILEFSPDTSSKADIYKLSSVFSNSFEILRVNFVDLPGNSSFGFTTVDAFVVAFDFKGGSAAGGGHNTTLLGTVELFLTAALVTILLTVAAFDAFALDCLSLAFGMFSI